jgi:hypothetical protein
MPQAMPGVMKMVGEKRREFGDQHVNLCWKRGVVELEPGWFFAREGALWVGTPPTDPKEAAFCAHQFTATQVLLYLRTPDGADQGRQ